MRELWINQSGNWFLWVPFLMAFGAGLYFNIANEPNFTICAIGMVALIILITLCKRVFVRAVMLFLFGFCYACVFTHIINTPQLSHPVHGISINGTVKNIDYTADKSRIYIKTDNGMNVRVSLQNNTTPPNIGDKIRANVGLFHPDGADAPESFDYARWAYFNGLTATGYINDFTITSHAHNNSISNLRDNLHRRAKSFLVDTLVLGYKNAVPGTDAEIWTATGVGHVWSISGFHITLVSAWLFAIFYLLFRAIAPITKRIPARIPALCCAWIGLLFYVILSGADVATMRAFIMATLVFVAFILGRRAISMRNVCIAFCVLFLMNPHFVMQPGFQLSFAAIFGLVWLWNDIRPKMPHNKILKIICTAVLTSVVATMFTAPFVITHFYDLPIYGLIGNLILLPIFSIAIMPLVCLGTVTLFIGWMGPINLAEYIYEICMNIGTSIATLPGATITMPHIPNTAMVFIICAMACIMFIRPIRIKINYIFGIILICIGICITALYPKPIFYVTNDHELAAFVGENGKLEFTKSRASNHYFTFDTWKRLNGEPIGTKNNRRKPNDGVWIYETPHFTLAYIQRFTPLSKNIVRMCRDENTDFIVSYFDIDAPQCNQKILRDGFVIYPSGKIRYVYHRRPWHIQH